MRKVFRVYGKKKSWKRFKPFDMKENEFKVNLIHVSFFDVSELEELKKEVNYMNSANKEYIFEIR